MEPTTTAALGGLTLKALWVLSRFASEKLAQGKAKNLVNKAYQSVTRSDKKLIKRKLDEEDLANIEEQIGDIYSILEVVLEELNDPQYAIEFLDRLQEAVQELEIKYDENLRQIQFLKESSAEMDRMYFHRFEIVYESLENVFQLLEAYETRIASLEGRMKEISEKVRQITRKIESSEEKLSRYLVPAIHQEGPLDKEFEKEWEEFATTNEFGEMVSTVGTMNSSFDEFQISVQLGRDILEAYIAGAITYHEALSTLQILKDEVQKGFERSKNIAERRELLFLIEAIKEQIEILDPLPPPPNKTSKIGEKKKRIKQEERASQ